MDKEKRKKALLKSLINLLKIIFVVTIIIVVIVFIIPLAVNLIVETPNPFGLGFINDSNKDTWVPFFGSIIGGSITLIGVIWTIKHEKEQKIQELAIQYRPVLEANIEDSQIISIKELDLDKTICSGVYCFQIGNSKNKDKIKIFTIKFLNLGNGECYIKCADVPFIDSGDIYFNEISAKNTIKMSRLLLHKNWFNTIARKQSILINLYVVYDETEQITGTIHLSFPFKSTDMFDYTRYNNNYILSLSVKFNDKKNKLEINNDAMLIENELIKNKKSITF